MSELKDYIEMIVADNKFPAIIENKDKYKILLENRDGADQLLSLMQDRCTKTSETSSMK